MISVTLIDTKTAEILHLQVAGRLPLQPVQLQELQLLSRRGPRP